MGAITNGSGYRRDGARNIAQAGKEVIKFYAALKISKKTNAVFLLNKIHLLLLKTIFVQAEAWLNTYKF